MKTFQYKIQQKMEETFSLEPADLGLSAVTDLYKRITSFVKIMPFIYIIPLSFVIAVFLYVLFGSLIVKLATLLQYGF